jgi:hypothetical protein
VNQYQDKYLQELYDLKVHTTYQEIYLEKSENIDKYLNGFLAIVSSSSIGGWALWKDYQAVWATFIVISQIINAIKIYLPYSSRIKALAKTARELESLSIKYEKEWYYIAEGEKTEEEINTLRFDLKEKKTTISRKYFTTTTLPVNKKYLEEAEEVMQEHFANYYT